MLFGMFDIKENESRIDEYYDLQINLPSEYTTGSTKVTVPLGVILSKKEGGVENNIHHFRHFTYNEGNNGIVLDGYLLNPLWDTLLGLIQKNILNHSPSTLTEFNGSYNLLKWDWSSRAIYIANDLLGFRSLFYWVSSDQSRLIISSSLSLIVLALSQVEPDLTAFGQQLLISSILNGNSLVKDIYRLLPGSFISVSPEGIKIHPSDMGIRWGSEYHHMSLEETADLIIEISSEVLRNWIDHENINVSLSGGYDSRFLTLLALRHAKSIKAVNLGTKDWIDSKLAGQFCSAKDLSLEICSPPDHVSLAEYLTAIRMVEHTSDYLSPCWLIKYSDCVSQMKQPILNGFFGGPLTGSTIKWVKGANDNWPQIVKDWYSSVNACNVPIQVIRQVCKWDIDNIEKEILNHLNAFSSRGAVEPYQRLCNLEFRVRQYGFVALGTYNLFRKFSHILVPFTDHRLLHLFTNLSYEHLIDQRAYIHSLRLLDDSNVPFASTSARLLYPSTYSKGPQAVVENTFRRLTSGFIDYINDNQVLLCDYFYVDKLKELLTEDSISKRQDVSISQRLILLNAAILLIEYSRPEGAHVAT